jgi:hypothetical protein
MQIDFGFGGGRKSGCRENQGKGGEEISRMFHTRMFHARDYRTDRQRFARGKGERYTKGPCSIHKAKEYTSEKFLIFRERVQLWRWKR